MARGDHAGRGRTGLDARDASEDYGHHWVHRLRAAGYESVLIGEQHISADPRVIGYDEVIEVESNHATQVTPNAIRAVEELAEPWFLSVGFFETHRSFAAPQSVRDTLYSLPPAHLPDTQASRRDMAAFKASVRSLDQGIGAVLNALHHRGLLERTLIICTTDHGLALPRSKATLFDRGVAVMLLMRGPGGFTGGKVFDAMVSQLDLYPTICDVAEAPHPDWLQGRSLLPLVGGETNRLHDELFAEMTYHAAYEPLRSIRTKRWKYIKVFHDYPHPVLANCDDSAAKDLLVDRGWGETVVPREHLYDLVLDPEEGCNLVDDPCHADVRTSLADRLERLGLPAVDAALLDPPLRRQSDAVNDDWVQRFSDLKLGAEFDLIPALGSTI